MSSHGVGGQIPRSGACNTQYPWIQLTVQQGSQERVSEGDRAAVFTRTLSQMLWHVNALHKSISQDTVTNLKHSANGGPKTENVGGVVISFLFSHTSHEHEGSRRSHGVCFNFVVSVVGCSLSSSFFVFSSFVVCQPFFFGPVRRRFNS